MPLKKLTYGLLGILLVYAVVRSVLAAAGKPFWYDELLTLTVSSQGTWNAIVTALRGPLDGQPPLFYVIEHFASRLTRNQEVALRLPSILAFPCALACVFVYVKKSAGEIVGLLCALFLLTTGLFQYYAVEARPYSMVAACIAFGLVCYQRVPSPLWTVLLALSLALGQSLHYLAVLAMVPFGLAEAAFFLKTRKVRWPVWLALMVGAVPLLLFWNLLAINKAYYGAHFWTRFPFSRIPNAYGELFLTNSQYGAAIGAVVLAGVLGTALWQRAAASPAAENTGEDLAEATLLFTFAGLPFAGYLFSIVTHVGMTTRYVLPAVLGVAAAFGYMLSCAKRGAVALFAMFVFSVLGVHELHFWRFFQADISDVNSSGIAVEKLLESAGHEEMPVIVSSGLVWVPVVHYALPSSANRFVYLMEDPRPHDPNWSDTLNKGVQLLQNYVPLRFSHFSDLTSAHREFLFYKDERDPGIDWLMLRLIREGWTMQIVALDEHRRIYLITRND